MQSRRRHLNAAFLILMHLPQRCTRESAPELVSRDGAGCKFIERPRVRMPLARSFILKTI